MTPAEQTQVVRIDLGEETPSVYVAGPPRRWSVPIVAAPFAALAALAAALRFGATETGVLAAGLLPLLVILTAIDLRYRLVPNRLTFPALLAVLAFQLVFAPEHALEWILAAIGAPLLLLIPTLIRRDSVGLGDVKLAAVLGAALGAPVVSALAVGSLAAVPFAGVMLVRGVRSAALPFVPFLAFGAAVVLLAG